MRKTPVLESMKLIALIERYDKKGGGGGGGGVENWAGSKAMAGTNSVRHSIRILGNRQHIPI